MTADISDGEELMITDSRSAGTLHALEATHDIRKVALWLGHASVQATEI